MGYFKWDTFVRILVGVLAALPTCHGVTNPQDVVAMNFLYAALGSPTLPGWVPAAGDPCGEGWQGVQCVNANITGIVLNDANLGGTLGESLNLFLSILQIQLRNNHIGGSIPSSLPSTLKTFDISSNQFTGSIPEIFSYLVHLTDLVLNKNHLTGFIPDGFQQLTELISLDLSDNNLDGQLPTSMGLLSSLTTLHLQDNHFVGTLDVLQDLPLIDLNIENNMFSGSIPQKLLTIPNFRRAGNSFDSAINTSSPSFPPSPAGAPASEESPLTQPNESATPENSHSSSKRQKVMTTKRIVGASVAALIIVIVLALAIWMFMSSCRKGMLKSGIFSKSHKLDADDDPKYNPRPNMTPLKLFSHNGNAQKEDVKPPARDENICGVNDLIPKRDAEQGKEFKKLSAVPRPKEVHNIDKTGKDVKILPPPLHPFERVVTETKVPTVTSKRHTTDKLNFGRTFTIASLQQFTNSFSQENFIGEGMFGTVYRAELPDGKLLAVKKLDIAASRQQSDEDFLDLVSSLSKLKHVNIVQLVGFCAEHGQRLLVYEYCGNGTVYEAIHIDDEIHKHLSWNARIHLALQAARALEYLHEICQPPIVHKNIKSANFLLDDVFAVRVSDCGLAPLISSNYLTQFQGSGYSAPELEMGNYTYQSDVYSLGVVMLELLTGRKSYDRSRPRAEQFLVRWAIPQLHDINALERMVDPSLKELYPSKSLSRLADIISLCVQPEPEFRPQMSEIVEDLEHLVERAS